MASGGVSPAPSSPIPFIHSSNTNQPSPLSISSSTPPPTKICVFCGASPGKSPAHLAMARSLAENMAANNISLVYGGGTVGLMGEVARTLVSLSGPDSVHGIIPAPLVKYERGPESEGAAAHSSENGTGLPEYAVYGKTTVVKDMHTRKAMMAQEVLAGGPGSGFVALSGGYGTLEELMEVVTWNQLGIHNRGVVVLNVEGYWDGLMAWIQGSVQAGFVGEGSKGIVVDVATAEEAVKALRDYKVSEGRFKLEWGNE
ncbi:lysine decarboxylase protein [Rutstroemia sp. NJR-2017a WRK4]|nr:lysine decarboxylase protein [Rutstroemia sp. NJR-2017a BBW]PQE21622.1 lysine decarboxylase protein [Rutstroemia sp. NJR-2017a WRK4]